MDLETSSIPPGDRDSLSQVGSFLSTSQISNKRKGEGQFIQTLEERNRRGPYLFCCRLTWIQLSLPSYHSNFITSVSSVSSLFVAAGTVYLCKLMGRGGQIRRQLKTVGPLPFVPEKIHKKAKKLKKLKLN